MRNFSNQFLGLIFFLLTSSSLHSQIIDLRHNRNLPKGPGGAGDASSRPIEFLKKGAFGFANDLSAQANTEILRLRIGDTEKNSIPLFLVLASPSLGLAKSDLEQLAMNSLISQTGGIINTMLADSRSVFTFGRKTTLSINYGAGYKLVNARNSDEEDPLNLNTFYSNFGLRFATGAYVEGQTDKKGTLVFQLDGFASAAFGNKKGFSDVFSNVDGKWFYGITGDVLLYISETIDLRLSFGKSLTSWDFKSKYNGFFRISVDQNF